MPLSCWLNCITIPIINGARNVGEQINSIVDIWLSDCWARSSARISSISSSTELDARNRRRARRASSSHCLVINRYLGDSGHIGNRISCNIAGQMAKPSSTGHPSFVPKICSTPNTWDKSKPIVTANWLTVPRPPRKFNGAISDIYIGTSDVFKPKQKREKDICDPRWFRVEIIRKPNQQAGDSDAPSFE